MSPHSATNRLQSYFFMKRVQKKYSVEEMCWQHRWILFTQKITGFTFNCKVFASECMFDIKIDFTTSSPFVDPGGTHTFKSIKGVCTCALIVTNVRDIMTHYLLQQTQVIYLQGEVMNPQNHQRC